MKAGTLKAILSDLPSNYEVTVITDGTGDYWPVTGADVMRVNHEAEHKSSTRVVVLEGME